MGGGGGGERILHFSTIFDDLMDDVHCSAYSERETERDRDRERQRRRETETDRDRETVRERVLGF